MSYNSLKDEASSIFGEEKTKGAIASGIGALAGGAIGFLIGGPIGAGIGAAVGGGGLGYAASKNSKEKK